MSFLINLETKQETAIKADPREEIHNQYLAQLSKVRRLYREVLEPMQNFYQELRHDLRSLNDFRQQGVMLDLPSSQQRQALLVAIPCLGKEVDLVLDEIEIEEQKLSDLQRMRDEAYSSTTSKIWNFVKTLFN